MPTYCKWYLLCNNRQRIVLTCSYLAACLLVIMVIEIVPFSLLTSIKIVLSCFSVLISDFFCHSCTNRWSISIIYLLDGLLHESRAWLSWAKYQNPSIYRVKGKNLFFVPRQKLIDACSPQYLIYLFFITFEGWRTMVLIQMWKLFQSEAIASSHCITFIVFHTVVFS